MQINRWTDARCWLECGMEQTSPVWNERVKNFIANAIVKTISHAKINRNWQSMLPLYLHIGGFNVCYPGILLALVAWAVQDIRGNLAASKMYAYRKYVNAGSWRKGASGWRVELRVHLSIFCRKQIPLVHIVELSCACRPAGVDGQPRFIWALQAKFDSQFVKGYQETDLAGHVSGECAIRRAKIWSEISIFPLFYWDQHVCNRHSVIFCGWSAP